MPIEAGQRRTARRRPELAQALVEFAMVAPLLLILISGLVDFGFGLKSYLAVTNASREGARYGVVGFPMGSYPDDCNSDADDDRSVVARACSALGGSVAKVQSVAVSTTERNGFAGIQNGDSIVVGITYRYDFVTPLGALLSAFTAGSVPATIDLRSTTDMRLE